ncbi:hypothetical protein [Sphingomonas sanxanigenens]|uniref:Uncharacterized protein n=1 Tax=Sphingomonas sanxanigenens DSM 19645 = NX02 TaxID=1123269 RepID=W0AE16_9SPHN|nr:hypothetical protein [Sphingomonas sanxanigenens]AHE54513.1 hypothetical protein NX02_14130 [Sphingomonas sanxanigenens DSM 19645 = NX02]
MAIYRVLGEQLVAETEFSAKGADLVRSLNASLAGGDAGPEIMLDDGSPFAFAAKPAAAATAATTGFTPVRFGSPVAIDIRHVYTGKVGDDGGFLSGGTGDIAVVSGVKTWGAFQASARALNWIAPKKGKKSNLGKPGALRDGTPIIAYQKAIATRQLTVTVELSSAPRDKNILDHLASAFTAAAGIPLFMPYSGALLAAGQLLPAAGKLLESISGSHRQWDASEDLNFGLAGTEDADAGFRVIADANAGLEGLRFDAKKGLIDAAGQSYSGDQPYIVIAVDGAPQTELEAFTPAVTSAEVLKRFRMGQTGQSPIIDDLTDLMTIISDVKFRGQAMDLKEKIADLTGADKDKAQAQYDALVKNIMKKELKPPV